MSWDLFIRSFHVFLYFGSKNSNLQAFFQLNSHLLRQIFDSFCFLKKF